MPLMPPIPLLAPEWQESLPALNTPLTPPTPPDAPRWLPTLSTPPRSPQFHLMPAITLLSPKYLQSLPAPQYTPDILYTPVTP